MEKKKITAGSVEELLEIVRAVRDGEDPDIDKIREEQRRKREEQILERRRKRSGGSADSAGPVRASQKGSKGEQKQEKDRKKEERKQKESSGKPDEPEPEEAQKSGTDESEPEDVIDKFSWPQFDPAKILKERTAKEPESHDDAPSEAGKNEADATSETDEPKDRSEEEEEDTERGGIFRPPWRNFLGRNSGGEDDEPSDEPDEDESDDEDNEPDEDESDDEEDDEPDRDESDDEEDDEPDGDDDGDDRPRRKEPREDEDDFDDDEFERMLDDDSTEEEFIKSKETVTAFTSKAAEVFGGLLQKAGGAAAKGKERVRKKAGEFEELSGDMFPDKEPGAKKAGDRPEREQKELNVDPEAEKKSLRSLERSLIIWRQEEEDPNDGFSYRESSGDRQREETPTQQSGPEDEIPDVPDADVSDARRERLSQEPEDRGQKRNSSDAEDREQKRPSRETGNRSRERDSSDAKARERKNLSEESGDRKQKRDSSDTKDQEQKRSSRETGNRSRERDLSDVDDRERKNLSEESGDRRQKRDSSDAKDPKRKRSSRARAGRRKGSVPHLPENVTNLLRAARSRILDGWNSLNQRGIHKREMAMLAIVLLFILLILFFLVTAVRNFFSQKQKSRNVTAEDGLIVTVEDEPQKWASSYPVQLKILCKKGSVSSVTINGVSCTPDENGMVTLETGDWQLQAKVETDDGSKKAEIEIPMLDGEAPALDIEREGDKIVLSATDARSQVAGIYYAIEDPGKYQQMPLYQKYQEPIDYEEGMIYRFYAKDKAGNISTPTASTLEDAESFTLGQTRMSLFPGETCSLSVEASPKGALLRNLKFESLDTAVVTVEDNGKVTAAGEGTAEVLVSADGMESQTCTFDVSTERSVLVSAVGDCTLGTDESFNASTSFNAFDSVHGHEYFFRNVKDILGSDDVTFANFEGTLTDSTAREAKQFAFKGDPSYAQILKDGSVEVVTLANNHSKDYGEQSLEDTKEALKEAGIDYCIGDEIVMREVNGVQIAFIGIYVLDIGLEVQTQVVQTITQARQNGADLVIVAFHWGSEKATSPDETQRSLAHTAIDRGADLVVGHHPHVLQGIEQYKGKYIVYSLANFCFGGNSSPSDMDTMIFQQNFTVGQDGAVENGEISIIPCSISSESGYNNYQPTPASGSEAERIMGRLNEYSEEFGQTYKAAER